MLVFMLLPLFATLTMMMVVVVMMALMALGIINSQD